MPGIAASIEINDEDAADLLLSLSEMEVEDDHRLAATFKIKLGVSQLGDGSWSCLDDERLALWSKVSIKMTVAEEETELIKGYITHIKPNLHADESKCEVLIIGMDGSCLMSLEEKIKDWPNKTDSDIANEIFQDYSLDAQVDQVEVVHEEAVSTIIQRETDIRFLKRLARRNGFECFVKGDTGYFRKPVFTDPPQPILAAHFGGESNLISFAAHLNGLRPATVQMQQIDAVAKEMLDANVEQSDQLQLGRDGALAVTIPNGNVSKMYVKQALATSQAEMQNLCTALLDEAEWFSEAHGEINSVAYGSALEARKLVPIRGVSEPFSGLYYVTNVKHVFTVNNYTQKFTARRNALAPGPDDFGSSLLGGLV